MSARAQSYRYERKFLVPPEGQSAVERDLKLNPGVFCPHFPPRTVNNIYLDSPAMGLYFLNLHGAAQRAKVRIRWYGERMGELRLPVLEFKTKRGLLGGKESYPLKPFCLDDTFNGIVLRQVLSGSDLPEAVRPLLIGLEPALLNSYRRRYYQSADRLYRLTWDSRLEFYRLRWGHNSLLGKAPRCPVQVLELKYDPADAAGAEAIASALPCRLTRMSKYVFGVESLNGY